MSEQNSEPRPFDPPMPPTAPLGAPTEPPTAPPAPPSPPSPEVPPMPQYGEYAPAGYVPPSPPEAANPYGIPGYAAPATPSNTYGVPATAAPAYAPLARKRRTWDTVLTSILLVLAVLGTVIALLYAWIFSNPTLLADTMTSAGFGGFSGNVGAASTILAATHIGLFIVTAALSILLLVRGRIVVFWIPLVAGVVAAIIFWVVVFSVIASDPNFVQNSQNVGG